MGQASQHLLLKIGKYCQGHQYDVIIFNLWGMMEDHLKVTKFFSEFVTISLRRVGISASYH